MTIDLGWFARQAELMEREPQDVGLDFDGDLPLRGLTIDGAEYNITLDPLRGDWNVWVTKAIDEAYETSDRVFHGTKNECKNYVFWNMEVET